jgi:hypothetical protein
LTGGLFNSLLAPKSRGIQAGTLFIWPSPASFHPARRPHVPNLGTLRAQSEYFRRRSKRNTDRARAATLLVYFSIHEVELAKLKRLV